MSLVVVGLLAGCGASGPVETGRLEMGGDSGEPARIDTRVYALSGVESGDTVMFFPGNGKQMVEHSNPVTFRYYEERKLEGEGAARGVTSLVISHTVSRNGGQEYSRNHLIDLGSVEKGKPVQAKIRFAVTNVGTEAIPTFLIVHKLPAGFRIPKVASLEIDAGDTNAEWELDDQGRLLVRETRPIKPATTQTYTLDMEFDVPR